MRIYFYDGRLDDEDILKKLQLKNKKIKIIDAADGFTKNREAARACKVSNTPVLTNQVTLLCNDYCWRDTKHFSRTACECLIYIEEIQEWRYLQDLTSKQIQRAHNLEKMYIAGVFDYDPDYDPITQTYKSQANDVI